METLRLNALCSALITWDCKIIQRFALHATIITILHTRRGRESWLQRQRKRQRARERDRQTEKKNTVICADRDRKRDREGRTCKEIERDIQRVK